MEIFLSRLDKSRKPNELRQGMKRFGRRVNTAIHTKDRSGKKAALQCHSSIWVRFWGAGAEKKNIPVASPVC